MDNRSTVIVFVTTVTLLHFALLSSASKTHHNCRYGEEYYNREKGACVPCSQCKENTLPHRQCHGTQDTLCRPFGKFEFRQSDRKPAEQSPVPEKPNAVTSGNVPEVNRQTATTVLVADESSDEKWFTITMVLAGILVVTCIAGAILLLITCYMCKKKQREIIYDPAFAGSLLGYDGHPQTKTNLYKIVTET